MENTKKLAVGILAHVDAGKTTLAEGILYTAGAIRKLGRVDHKDAFLDTYQLEKNRGITIFSKQAQFRYKSMEVTLLDTPGHVDFSAEMERTLQVLDYAILVISGPDGVQGHIRTLWRLLKQYDIPVFVFVNKMDQPGTQRDKILEELCKSLDSHCMDFGKNLQEEEMQENLAVCEESLLESYLEGNPVTDEHIRMLIRDRKVFPCFFGSALKMEGVEEFLDGLDTYTQKIEYPEQFGARIYKIARDSQGTRLTYLKVTGGNLKAKALVSDKENGWEEKIDQIRLYSGAKFQTAGEVPAGTICAVTGLTKTRSGGCLGVEKGGELPLLEPVLNYRIELPEGCDVYRMFLNLKELEEEEPQLHIVWKETLGEIHVQLMGEVQTEILTSMIKERFGVDVSFGAGNIVYKETIENTVEGVGHFEPLRHYAEVHLLLEPGEPGSGLQFLTDCSEDELDKNWQRLVLTHLEEKRHTGALTGSEITDMRITLIAGRAHLKHTEGGDFRQATYRAVRQGLRKAKSVLLEPVYEFSLEIPAVSLGRALSDLQRMYARTDAPMMDGENALLHGFAPVVCMQGYQKEVVAYTKGCGRLSCELHGYEPCHNAEEVIENIAYDADADLENTADSVFCAHGAGFIVPWYQVEEYMHIKTRYSEPEPEEEIPQTFEPKRRRELPLAEEKELEEIFARTYGNSGQERKSWQKKKTIYAAAQKGGSYEYSPSYYKKPEKEYLLVDGYNIIFAWDDLKELAKINIEAARDKLMDILSNYQGYKKNTLILVFDAYKVKGGQGSVFRYHNIYVVYTKEAETADMYIEKTVHEIGRKHKVMVATSDGLEQVIILGQGAARMSAAGLLEEIQQTRKEIREQYLTRRAEGKNYLSNHMPEEMAEFMEQVRLGKKEFDNSDTEKNKK